MAKYATQTTITPEQASEVAVEFGLDRPHSSECIQKVRRAFDILRKHREGEIVTVSGLGTHNEVFYVPSQAIWHGTEGRVYEVRHGGSDWSTCSCAEWRRQASKCKHLPIVPYECKHGVAVRLVLTRDVVFDATARFDGTHRCLIEGKSEPMRVSKVLAQAIHQCKPKAVRV